VDAPQLGKREKDQRLKMATEMPSVQKQISATAAGSVQNQGVSRAISSFIDPSLSWYLDIVLFSQQQTIDLRF
jgi:L-lactate dehydrogenase (cytochrome)